VQLLSADGVDTQTHRDLKPRNLQREKDDDDDDVDAARFSRQDAENDEFQYPGHIPPLKYVSV